jgi:predicted component of type VI protein secretion system
VRLHAFPPAELIAEGKPPVDVETTIILLGENGTPRVSGETPLPNVTGALVDECGNLAGYSSANGVQSMSTGEFPRYQFRDTLIRLAGELELNPKMADCRPETAIPAEPEPEADASESQPEPEEQPPQEAPTNIEDSAEPEQPEETEPEASEVATEPEADGETGEPVAEPDLMEEVQILPPLEAPVEQTPPEEDPGLPAWLWLLFALILLGGGFLVHRLRKRAIPSSDEDQSTRPQPLPVAEDTLEEAPFTPRLDSELLVSGDLTDGNVFEVRCPVSSQAINLVIGRGQADITIESPAISRRHATINGTANQLTLSDLGSSNGTSINGVPCLEGETMFIKPGDTIIVGNARFRFTIEPASTEHAAE